MNIGIVVAAGKGTRMNTEVPKQMLPYRDSTVLECAARPFAEHPDIDEIVIVTPEDGSNADFYLKTARAPAGCFRQGGTADEGRKGTRRLRPGRSGYVRKYLQRERNFGKFREGADSRWCSSGPDDRDH